MKITKLVVVTAVLTSVMATTAFAGTWQTGTGENQGKWWYDNGNGSYTSNGWQWIDGNGDGTAEYYYFDNNGWLLTNTTTPGGQTVNADGAWVENGVVQNRNVLNNISYQDLNNIFNQDLSGNYAYYKTQLYVKNEATQSYELYAETSAHEGTDFSDYENLSDERYKKLGAAADIGCLVEIKNEGENKIRYTNDNLEDIIYELQGNVWFPVYGNEYTPTIVFENNSVARVYAYTGIEREEEHPLVHLNNLAGKELIEKEIFKKY